MKRLTLLCTLYFCAFTGQQTFAQDFSNKGKDFFLCFPNHVPSGANLANMSLFITSDKNSAGVITVGPLIIPFTVTANQIAGPYNIPYATAHITTAETNIVVPKGIRVKVNTGQPAVVVYSHIYAAARSAASLILPTTVLGKKYFSCNFWQASTGGSRSQFQIIAVDSNTTVQYQLRRNGVLDPVPVVRTLPLPGDVLQIQDQQDLTGSVIESIAVAGEGCKKIAVFSGSSAVSIGSSFGNGGSFDPLFQQLYPVNTWGKEYGVIPFANNPNGYHFRVIASENNTTINVGGSIIVLNEGDHYPTTNPNPAPYTAPMVVTADKPVSAATYTMSANRNGGPGGNQGDPDMVILNPIEQGIKDISVFSSSLQAINAKFLQAYIKTIAVPSFRINGNPPTGIFVPMVPANGYSYLVENITNAGTNSFRITADSSFNAVAYGLGDFESYAYSAGTNVKDIYQFISIQNQHSTVTFPATCRNTPFYFSMVFPYQPTQIQWDFGGLFPNVTIGPTPAPAFDSTWFVNGRQVYRYRIPTPYSLPLLGTFPIRVIANNPTPGGCSGEQEIEFDLQVFDPPTAEFNFTTDGCLTNPVFFRDSALNTQGRPVISYWWDFADATTSTLPNPTHTYVTAGTYNVRHVIITDVGCISDTLIKPVAISNPPVAGFTPSTPRCVGRNITFTDGSSVPPGNTLAQWLWDFGDGNTVNASNGNAQTHAYAAPGNYTVTLRVVTTSGCQSVLFSMPVTINVNPVAGFNFPTAICLPVGASQFTNTSTISDGSGPQMTYSWNFGDGNTSTQANPLHNYSGTGPYTVTLTATSNNGCTDDSVRLVNTIYSRPTASFNVDSLESCFGGTVNFSDISTAPGSTVTQWFWDFGDASTSTLQNPNHQYAATGTYTVRLWINSGVGCRSDTMSRTITILQLPTVSFTNSTPVCQFGNVTLTSTSNPIAGVISQYSWTVNGTPAGGNNASIVYVPTTTGAHTVALNVLTDRGCTNQGTRTITVNAKPVAGFNFPNICLPVGAAQFTNTSTISDGTGPQLTYQWNFGDGNTSTQANPLHNYSGTGPYTVTLTATSNNGCTDDSVRIVNTIFSKPTASFNVDSLESCYGGTVNFTDVSTAPGSTVTQWFWDFGDASTSTVQNPNHQYAATGTYTVRLWVNSGVGCRSDTMSRTITILQLPTVSFTSSTPVCQFGNISLNSTSTPVVGVFTQYNWTVNGTPTGGNNASVVYVPVVPGAHTISLNVLTDRGCMNQASQTINVNAKPVAAFNFPNICLPVGAAQFTNTSTISDGTGPQMTYQWNFGDGNTSTQANPLHNYSGTGPYNVTLIATSNNGCIDDTLRIVNTIYAEPQAAFTALPEVCLGNSISFTDQSNAANALVNSWQWDFGDGNTSTLQSPSHVYAAAGTYTVRLRVGTDKGCQTVGLIATRTVVVNPLPTPDFNTSSPICETRGITFTDISSPNAGNLVTWRWNFGDGNNSVFSASTPFIHTYATAGNYTATLQVETNKGCISTVLNRNIIVNNRPLAGYIAPEICLTDPFAPFMDTSRIAAGSITSWQWNFGDPNANAGNPNTSTLQNPTHRYITTGNYTATLVATSALGCKDTIAQSFTVNGSVPVAGFTVNNPNTLCSNQTVSITDASTVDFGNLVRVEIYWDYTNNPTIKTTDDVPVSGRTYTHNYPEFGSPATRTYTVRYVAYSGINCVNTISRTITVLATPTVFFNPLNAVCDNIPSFRITQAGISNGLPGSGVFTGTGISSSGIFDPATAGAGNHAISYVYTGSNGCINSASQPIQVNISPNANAGPDKTVLEGGVVALTPALFAGLPVTYTWSPPLYLNNPNIPGATVQQPLDDITYTLRVETNQGCFDVDQVFVKVLKAPVVPNAFSPNGDGIHDTWDIAYIETYPGAVIDVYNRYGQLVYHTINYTTPWNGKINGKDAPMGTYYYIIDPKNGRKPLTGFVDIIR